MYRAAICGLESENQFAFGIDLSGRKWQKYLQGAVVGYYLQKKSRKDKTMSVNTINPKSLSMLYDVPLGINKITLGLMGVKDLHE